MAKLISWIKAARPKTLLLSIACTMMGGLLAALEPSFNFPVVVFSALTALLLQNLSNFANDYGDFVKGTDDENRAGPPRVLQSGELTKKQMRIGIIINAILALICGAVLIFVFVQLTWTELAVFAGMGVLAIVAALLYTLGKHPYGYNGLGDLSIFLFFGWVAVFGTYYLATKTIDFSVLLPASTMGFLSSAGMNVNNMRDYENDKVHKKHTMVVMMGQKNAYIYHCLLIGFSFVCLTVYLVIKQAPYYAYAFWLLSPLFIKDLIVIKRTKPELIDPFLGRLVRLSFLLALVFCIPLLI